jgi:hypothetical protein
MKKFLIAGNILFASIIYFQNCTPAKMIIGAQPGSKKNWHCINYHDSIFNGIPLTVADLMYNIYGTKQYNTLTGNALPNSSDSRSVWFSLDVLKKFFYKVEDTLHNQGKNQAMRLGIRFYFGTYPEGKSFSSNPYFNQLPANYAGKHTLFLVPTFDEIVNNITVHKEFNAFRQSGELNMLLPMQPILLDTSTTVSTTPVSIFTITNDIYMQNHGEVGPPPAPIAGTTF